VPRNTRPDATALGLVVGHELMRPLLELEIAYKEAADTVAAVEANRRGGEAWTIALDEDAEACLRAAARPGAHREGSGRGGRGEG
jgi:hypothetical protein